MNVVVGDPLYRPFAAPDNPRPRPEDAEFYLYRSAMRRLGNQPDKSALMRELETSAERRKSGILWEALGLLAQTYYPEDLKRAAQYFEKAGKAYRNVPDRVRSYLHVPDMERRNEQIDGAVTDLKRIISEFPKAPETEAARAWLATLRPPPPPAPNPLKR